MMPEVDDKETMTADSSGSKKERFFDTTLGIVVFFAVALFCFAFPSFALAAWGPWAAIVASLACGGFWIAFGPKAFPGLLQGCLAIGIPGNALVIIAISLYKLI